MFFTRPVSSELHLPLGVLQWYTELPSPWHGGKAHASPAYLMLQEALDRESVDFLFCTPMDTSPGGRLYFWSTVYYYSKYYELLDTILLVLRVKPTSFLHVFHHAVVISMSWLWVDQVQTLQFIGLLANTAVHVVMYYYYYLTVICKSPWWKKYITWMQIVQFVSR